MADYSTIFLLILAALTFVIIGMSFIVYLMILGEREKNKLRAKLDSFARMETTQECPHSFGYLTGHPQNQPIPEECFGCPRAVECMNEQKETDKSVEITDSPEQQ